MRRVSGAKQDFQKLKGFLAFGVVQLFKGEYICVTTGLDERWYMRLGGSVGRCV
jgi:hypothetical protein